MSLVGADLPARLKRSISFVVEGGLRCGLPCWDFGIDAGLAAVEVRRVVKDEAVAEHVGPVVLGSADDLAHPTRDAG
jgi:hypothetical protein